MSYLITNIYKFILPIFGIVQKPTPLFLKDFKQITIIKDDYWNKIPASNFKIDFYDKLNNNKYAGYISYRAGVGQVGLFILESDYRNRGLGKQILTQTIEHMKEFNTTHIWAITIDDHPFWSNVFNKSFEFHEMRKVHPSVTGSGYKMKIN
jgi:GNAT superfamily N-acetyltransferase